MAKEVKVSCSHNWFEGQEVWIRKDEFGYASVRRFGGRARKEADDSITEMLGTLFSLTGLGPWSLKPSHGTVEELYQFIYSIEMPKDVSFIRLSTCCCNTGECSAITGVEKQVYKTFGDFAASVGQKHLMENDGGTPFYWYEHPDSVFLYIERFNIHGRYYFLKPKFEHVEMAAKDSELFKDVGDQDCITISYGR